MAWQRFAAFFYTLAWALGSDGQTAWKPMRLVTDFTSVCGPDAACVAVGADNVRPRSDRSSALHWNRKRTLVRVGE